MLTFISDRELDNLRGEKKQRYSKFISRIPINFTHDKFISLWKVKLLLTKYYRNKFKQRLNLAETLIWKQKKLISGHIKEGLNLLIIPTVIHWKN